MGRVTVRAAIAAWLAPANVAGLGTLYPATPKFDDPAAYKAADNGGSGSVAIIHMPSDGEVRKGIGGQHSGTKFPVHKVALEIRFQSVKPDAIAAQTDYDALVDAFITQMRADRNFGAPSVIWQAGEFAAGISHSQAEPVLATEVWMSGGVINFEAWETVRT